MVGCVPGRGGLVWIVQDVQYPLAGCPAQQRPARELRTLVGSHGRRITPESGCLVQQPVTYSPPIPWSTARLTHSWLKSSVTAP